jgi:hypothetical protein
MDRLDILQEIVNRQKARTYLEIGVKKGKVFLNIKARKKIAVDTHFKIDMKRKIKSYFKNITNIFNEYYEMTSDDFFEQHPDLFAKSNGLDVAFIDGLHTYKQSLRDVQNCLDFLNKDGVIVMHDCNPLSEVEAQPADSQDNAATLNLPGWSGSWSGDVWKTIALLRSTRTDLNIFVLDCDHGVGIIVRGEPEDMLNYSEEIIGNLSYKDLEKDRTKILNLKNTDFFKQFFSSE